MRLQIHRAIFGEQDGCHAILASSLDRTEAIRELRGRSDRPPFHSPGMNWEPFERGFVIGEWFALCRTFPHPEASRGGMVKTFAILTRLADVGVVGNFSTLVAQLPVSHGEEWPCVASEAELVDHQVGEFRPEDVPGVTQLIRALINRPDPKMPVTLVGQAGALDVITALWDSLWPAMRRRFQFDLLFGATDLDRLGLTVAMIPERAANIWPGGSPLVRITDPSPGNPTPVEAAILHQPLGDPIHVILRELDVDPEDFRALQRAALCVEHRARLAKADAADIHAYVGLLAALAPNPKHGVAVKDAALKIWIGLAETFRATDVLAVRNFSVSSFVGGESIVSDLTARWLRSHVPDQSSADDTACIVLQALEAEPYCRIWNESVLKEVTALLTRSGTKLAKVLWRWWKIDWRLGRFAAAHLPESAAMEKALVTTLPDEISTEIAGPIRALAAAREWGHLHATVCAISLPADAAFAAQLGLPKAATVATGLRLLAAHFPAISTIEAALSSGDARLIPLAGEQCANTPALVATMDLRGQTARQVLLAALESEPGLWRSLDERHSMLHGLLDLVLDGVNVEAPLLDQLSSTAEADLLEYRDRARVWSHLPPIARDGFLRATAMGWIVKFRNDPNATLAPEKPILDVVLQSPYRERLLAIAAPGDIAAGLQAFEIFPQLDEATMGAWIERLSSTQGKFDLNRQLAGRLGALILRNKWFEAAQALRRALNRRSDVAPALRACLPLFGLFDRIAIHLALPGKSLLERDEFWNALEEEFITTYPQGPMQQKIWSRAGGDESTLEQHGNGRQQWRSAIQTLKRGGGGKNFKTQKLLATAASDFSRNNKISILEKYAREIDV